MWVWFYEIRGRSNRLVKRDGEFDSEKEAILAGTRYLQNNKAAIMQPDNPDEVFTVMSGRKLLGGNTQ
jgi:hypothetical protein